MKERRARSCPVALLAGLLLLVASAPAPGEGARPMVAIPGLSAERVPDPVLGGHVVRYHGGNRSGPTVVLIHGIGDNGVKDWQELIPSLLDDYYVLALDLPGFGASDGGNRRYDPDSYMAVVRELVEERAPSRPVRLMGHSMGGGIALRYAGAHPDDVERLLLISVPGLLNPASYLDFLVRLGEARKLEGDTMPSAEGTLDALVGRISRRLTRHSPDVDMILNSTRLREWVLGGEPSRIAGLALARTDFTESLLAVSAPTSLLWGVEDRIAPLRNGRMLAARLPPGDLTVLDGLAHVPMTEAPGRFNRWAQERLGGRYDEATLHRPAPAEPGRDTARCEGRDGFRLSGAWDRIVIRDCRNVVLEQVRARSIHIENSTVRLEAPHIAGRDVGMSLENSQVMLTAGLIEGEGLAIGVAGGHLDVAGAVLRGSRSVVRAEAGRAAEISFSMTRLERSGWVRSYHGLKVLQPGESL